MEEGIYNEIPMLAIPFFSDQLPNVESMVSKGLGLSLDFKTINKDKFKALIFEVIHDKRYVFTELNISVLSDFSVAGTKLVLKNMPKS